MEYQFARFQNTVCNFVERWNTYNVLCKVESGKWKMTILFLTYRQLFYILYLRIIMCIYIYICIIF